MLLEVSNVVKSYPGLPVLQGVSLVADTGEIVCLLGPSGCGKSTLLRIIGGLETPDAGQVYFAGRNLAGVPPHRREFGLMFQDYALFPHKDVFANVSFGPRMARLPNDEIAARAREMLALVGLAGYEQRRVTELSGGEQQRVALARSLASRPRLLMLDEPLGALDRALREQLMHDLRSILTQVGGMTTLYVTHDQEEAFAIADRIIILRARLDAGEGGRVEQEGTPEEVYRRPANAYVARFLGFKNLLAGEVRLASADDVCVNTPLGEIHVIATGQLYRSGDRVEVLIRPEAADVRPADARGPNIVAGRLRAASFRGSYYLIQTEHDGIMLTCEAPAAAELPPSGAALALWLDPSALALMPVGA